MENFDSLHPGAVTCGCSRATVDLNRECLVDEDPEHTMRAQRRQLGYGLRRPVAEVRWVIGDILILAVTFTLLFHNINWLRFSDESDNILGGQLIAKGMPLYSQYFSHHMPIPYDVATIASLLGLSGVTGGRLAFYAFLLFFFAVALWQGREVPGRVALYVVCISYGIGHPLFWGHMLLADNVFSVKALVIVVYSLHSIRLRNTLLDTLLAGLAAFVAIWFTLIAVYPVVLFLAFTAWLGVRRTRRPSLLRFSRSFVGPLVTISVLVLVWLACAAERDANGLRQ